MRLFFIYSLKLGIEHAAEVTSLMGQLHELAYILRAKEEHVELGRRNTNASMQLVSLLGAAGCIQSSTKLKHFHDGNLFINPRALKSESRYELFSSVQYFDND